MSYVAGHTTAWRHYRHGAAQHAGAQRAARQRYGVHPWPVRERSLADGWQGSAQSSMQVYVVCAALDWLGRGVIEDPARPNRGPLVDAIHLRYRGWDAATLEREWAKAKSGVGLAWCAEFVWVVVDDVCRQLGIPNCLPGWNVALGRAKDTLEKSRGKLPVVSWSDIKARRGVVVKRASGTVTIGAPEPGQIFYRTSQPSRQSSDSTGHMGLVVAYNASDGSFDTVEGNQGTTNRVARYHYAAADLERYSFEFIHVAECAAVKDTPQGGIPAPGDACMALATGHARAHGVVVAPPTTSPATAGSGAAGFAVAASGAAGASGGGASGSGTPAGAGAGTGDRDCSISSMLGVNFTSLSADQKQRACTDVRIRDLDVGLLFHYSELKRRDTSGRRYVAADILGATYGINDATHEFFGTRNGSAVNRRNPARNGRDQHTGLGIFKMRSGRLVYVLAEDSLQWHNVWQNNLIGAGFGDGRDPWRIHLRRSEGSNFAEHMAEALAGDVPLNGPSSAQLPRLEWVAQNGRQVVAKGVDGGGTVNNLFSSAFSFSTLQDILDAIEKQDKAGETRDLSPVVVTYNAQPVPWTKSLEQIVQVATMVVSVAIPVAGSFVSASVISTLQSVRDNLDRLMKAVGGLQGGDVVSLALDLGAVFLPETYQQYVAPAKAAYRAAQGKNPGELMRALALLSRTDLGMDVTKWGQQLIDGVGVDVASIARAAAKPFNYVREQVATLQVGQMIGTIADLTASDVDFARKLLKVTQQRISDVSYLATFVTSLAGGRHPATTPNMGGLARMVAMTGELASSIEGKSEGARSDVFAVLSLLGQGFAAPCATFRDLAYQTFRQQAERLRASNVTAIATPVLLGPEDSECFAYRVRQDVPGMTVLYGEPTNGGTPVVTGGGASSVSIGARTVPNTSPGPTNTGGSGARFDTVQTDFNTNVTANPGRDTVPSPPVHTDQGGTDQGGTNAGVIGTTTRIDTLRTDTGSVDRGTIDTVRTNDIGSYTPGTGSPNAGRPDTGLPNTGPPDNGQPGTGSPDTGTSGGASSGDTSGSLQTDWNTRVNVVPLPDCPPGYTRASNPSGGVNCIPPSPVVREQQCPPGYVQVAGANGGIECIPPSPTIREAQCPPGYTLAGGECVPPAPSIRPPTCPQGYQLQPNGSGGFDCVPTVTFRNDWTPVAPPPGNVPPSNGTPPGGTPPSGAPPGGLPPAGLPPGNGGWPPFIFTMPLGPASGTSGGCGCCD
ncbi:MAG TPA: hypothetical protein VHI13_11705 [Candidatus Kapabacteria bacterium]|nr:hypothetical protein [Candidatus Kapabacteria bacterium]